MGYKKIICKKNCQVGGNVIVAGRTYYIDRYDRGRVRVGATPESNFYIWFSTLKYVVDNERLLDDYFLTEKDIRKLKLEKIESRR